MPPEQQTKRTEYLKEVTRQDNTHVEHQARKIALPLAEAFLRDDQHFREQFVALQSQQQQHPMLFQYVLTTMPFNILDAIKRKYKDDSQIQSMIPEHILNYSMKICETLVRRKRLQTQQEATKDRLLELKQQSIAFIPVYDEDDHANDSFRIRNLTKEELEHPFIAGEETDIAKMRKVGSVSVLPRLAHFQRTFEVFSQFSAIGEALSPSVVAMGGSVLGCLLPQPLSIMHTHYHLDLLETVPLPLPNEIRQYIRSFLTDEIDRLKLKLKFQLLGYLTKFPYKGSDLDLFVSAFPHQQARQSNTINPLPEGPSACAEKKCADTALQLRQGISNDEQCEESEFYNSLYAHVSEHDEDFHYVKSRAAITFCGVGTRRNIQLISCGERTPEETLLDFDIDCVTFAYDGTQVFTLARGRRAINTFCNFMDPFVLRFQRARNRLAKYHKRGFSHLLLESCIHYPRCDIVLDPNVSAIWQHSLRSIELNEKWSKLFKIKEDGWKDHCTKDKYKLYKIAQEEELLLNQEHPVTILDAAFPDEELMSDNCFYGAETLPSFAENTHEIFLKVAYSLKFREQEASRLNKPYILPLVHDKSLPHLLSLTLPDVPSVTHFGKDLKRVGHACYMCARQTNAEYRDVLCAACIQQNKAFYNVRMDLTGKVALITGARIKVGYECALRLLRNNATVVGITRFPLLAQSKFDSEPDSKEWKHNLHLYGLDLRFTGKLVEFLHEFKQRFSRIDIIINNAAQTIRRPPQYYKSLLQQETTIANRLEAAKEPERNSSSVSSDIVEAPGLKALAVVSQDTHLDSAHSTQIMTIPSDRLPQNDCFPDNMLDRDGEPLDTRNKTSWNSTFDQLHFNEVIEVQLVNVTAPYVIISELSELLQRRIPVSRRLLSNDQTSGDTSFKDQVFQAAYKDNSDLFVVSSPDELFDWPNGNSVSPSDPIEFGRRKKIVINVTSPEGQFDAVASHDPTKRVSKRGHHPHTDMAKASLNKLTDTLSRSLDKYDCYVFGVDTGWFSDMRPVNSTPVNVPLTAKDACARILQPVFENIDPFSPPKQYGCLYKHFKPCDW